MTLRPLAAALIAAPSSAPRGAGFCRLRHLQRIGTVRRHPCDCFQSRVDGELQRLESEGRGFVIVNLSDCKAAPSAAACRPAPRPRTELPLDSSFVADDAALHCLKDAIVANASALDPSFLFDLTRLCP